MALAPIICMVATTMASTTDNSTAYSAISCPASFANPSNSANLANGRNHKLIPPDLRLSWGGLSGKHGSTGGNGTAYFFTVRGNSIYVPKTEQVRSICPVLTCSFTFRAFSRLAISSNLPTRAAQCPRKSLRRGFQTLPVPPSIFCCPRHSRRMNVSPMSGSRFSFRPTSTQLG